jgi:hypothetical protein
MWRYLFSCLLLGLSGCATTEILPSSEYLPFKAASDERRVITGAAKILIARSDDLIRDCGRHNVFMPAPTSPFFIYVLEGCARWSSEKKECIIFVRPNASNVVIGHEMRHCFEGSFHSSQ